MTGFWVFAAIVVIVLLGIWTEISKIARLMKQSEPEKLQERVDAMHGRLMEIAEAVTKRDGRV